MDYSHRHGHFRALLRRIREEAGLSQMDLAEKLGKPQTFVSKSELGERRIDFLETVNFCAACGVTVKQFLERLNRFTPSHEEEKRQKRRSPRIMDGEGRVSAR
jgi:transcriptional regulator with XRE-family HTH domain